MRREDLRAIEGMTEAQVEAVMRLAGQDTAAAQQRENELQSQLNTAQQRLAAFGTQQPGDLAAAQQQAADLQRQLNAQAADYRFRDYARSAAQDAGAIDVSDVVAALEQDEALKSSTNQPEDIAAAVQALKQRKAHWFKNSDPDHKIIVPNPNGNSNGGGKEPTVEEFAMMGYMARCELKAKNPALFASLCKDLQARANKF